MNGSTVVSILERLIDPEKGDLPPATAEAVLRLRVPEEDQSRVDELASKANSGTLTSQEAEEYDAYIAAANLLAAWKSKAQLSLKRQSSAV